MADLLRVGRREHVVWIDHTLRLNEHPVRLLAERHEIALLEFEGFEDIARYDDLPTLPHAPDAFLPYGRFDCHGFRLSDCQKLSIRVRRGRSRPIPRTRRRRRST